jgi:hypothetical protein
MAVMTEEAKPLFDNSRAALAFALNHSRSRYSAPLMNKAMAEVGHPVREIVLGDGTKIKVAVPKRRRPTDPQLRGMDGIAQAGMILLHLSKLPRPKQLVLIAGTLKPLLPCDCNSPCCAGTMPNHEWVEVVKEICEHLKDEAHLSRKRGKKGFSTHPVMRRALVEKHFIPGKRIILSELADLCNVSEATVVAHRKPIEEFLDRTDKDGMTALDILLTRAGIVGSLD